MDTLEKIIYRTAALAADAHISFMEGHRTEAYELLGELYDFLDDEVGSKARDKCESSESSKG